MHLKSNLIIEVSYRYEGTLLTIWREDGTQDFWSYPHEHLVQWYTHATQLRFMRLLEAGKPDIIGYRVRFWVKRTETGKRIYQAYQPNRLQAKIERYADMRLPLIYNRLIVKRQHREGFVR